MAPYSAAAAAWRLFEPRISESCLAWICLPPLAPRRPYPLPCPPLPCLLKALLLHPPPLILSVAALLQPRVQEVLLLVHFLVCRTRQQAQRLRQVLLLTAHRPPSVRAGHWKSVRPAPQGTPRHFHLERCLRQAWQFVARQRAAYSDYDVSLRHLRWVPEVPAAEEA